ncbi:MAG: nucleotidyltransferase domain-containing protein [Candidatus Methanoplasma sp.]|nr:nucleotidyltransferase domain-containing protein [Candidatus Methanoplasma sp.]
MSKDVALEPSFGEMCATVSAIAIKHGMKRMCLFGSRARGDNTPDSDYDFCVLPDKACDLFRLGSFLVDLREALGRDVDIVCEDSLRDDFRKEIFAEMKLIYAA